MWWSWGENASLLAPSSMLSKKHASYYVGFPSSLRIAYPIPHPALTQGVSTKGGEPPLTTSLTQAVQHQVSLMQRWGTHHLRMQPSPLLSLIVRKIFELSKSLWMASYVSPIHPHLVHGFQAWLFKREILRDVERERKKKRKKREERRTEGIERGEVRSGVGVCCMEQAAKTHAQRS